jgi:DNA repair exonuclease SbcCD nuclease subunit
MTWIVTSDLHLSDRPRDAYRWPIFDWLAKQQQKYKADATFILGDLTDRKDNHSSALVNRVIDELLKLQPPVYILRGNHDGIDPNNPFFRFLQTIEGLDFVVEPVALTSGPARGVALIPHQPNQAALDRACGLVGPKMAGVMMHQTLDGAMAETGARLSGLRCPLIEDRQPLRWLSGDIHRPQRLPCGLVYTGSPYAIDFGDDFEPRVLLVGNTLTDLHFPCLKKWTLRVGGTDFDPMDGPKPGDQVKIIASLSHEEVVGWAAIKRKLLNICREMEVQVFGVELEIKDKKQKWVASQPVRNKKPVEIFNAFCQAEKVGPTIKEAGQTLLEG